MYVLSQYAIEGGASEPKCEKRDIQSVGLIFPPGAAVGSPDVAVMDVGGTHDAGEHKPN